MDNEIVYVPIFISAQKLLEDKFVLEFTIYGNTNKNRKQKRIVELNLGDIACFVKPSFRFCFDTIVRVYYQNDIMVLNL